VQKVVQKPPKNLTKKCTIFHPKKHRLVQNAQNRRNRCNTKQNSTWCTSAKVVQKWCKLHWAHGGGARVQRAYM
jgi:hypothetical protein